MFRVNYKAYNEETSTPIKEIDMTDTTAEEDLLPVVRKYNRVA